MTRLSDLCPPEDADHTVNEDARDIKDKALGVKEFFMNICSKKKPDSIMQLFKDLRRRLCTEREEDDRPFEPEVYAAVRLTFSLQFCISSNLKTKTFATSTPLYVPKSLLAVQLI